MFMLPNQISVKAPRKVAIVGAGLIGGSVALACAHRWPLMPLAVSDLHGAAARQLAEKLDIEPAADLGSCVRAADLVVLAVPPNALVPVAEQVLEASPPWCVVTDVGSVKRQFATWAATLRPQQQARLIPGHPIAGGASAGCAHASRHLFEGRAVVLCPPEGASSIAVALVSDFWRALGSRVHLLDAEAHDCLYAALSHLPHLIAFGYVDTIASSCSPAQVGALGGASLRDFARIGEANPVLWSEILLSNRAPLLAALGKFELLLQALRAPLERQDCEALEQALARTARSHASLFPSVPPEPQETYP